MAIGPEVSDALDAMPARDVERLIEKAQRRLASCFACGTDGAFPATITSKKGGRNSTRVLDPHLRGLLGPGHAARGDGQPMGRPASPDYWRRWRAHIRRTGSASVSGPERDDGPATAHRRHAGPGHRRAHVVAPHPLLVWAQALAAGLVREDGRTRLSDELYPDVVGEILLARLERQDPVARATAWLRAERSWRHHLAPLLEAA